MSPKTIALIPGDGIGKEVVPEGKKVLELISENTDYDFKFMEIAAGGEIWRKKGESISEASFIKLKSADSILLGALGIPGLPQGAAEYAVLKIRQEFNQYVNLRPVKLYEALQDICPLKRDHIGKGIDLSIIRENSEGIYRKIGGTIQDQTSIDTMIFTKTGVKRLIQFGFNFAMQNHHTKITSVDKANLLYTSQMWRSIFEEEGKKYADITKESYYIDAFCQWLIRAPHQFQTVVTSNMFGDIISDEAAYLVGSLGMGASGNINPEPRGVSMFEPIHGSAPDIAGQNISNPIATILSVKLMFEHAFDDSHVGSLIDKAIENTLSKKRTIDIFPKTNTSKLERVSTQQMGDAIRKELLHLVKK
jgi:3-isopropylmalate dehydrogenase